MFCHECGQRAVGKFCSHCGTAIAAGQGEPKPAEVLANWEESFDYDAIVQVPEVATRMKLATEQAERGVSGQKLMQLIDQAATPLTAGVSSLALARITQPFTAKLGFKTGKDRRESIALPPGRVIANLAVAFARAGLADVKACHSPEVCELTAVLPVDLRALEGKLSITVSREIATTLVSAAALIEGAWYDWGKCTRRLDDLFTAARQAA